MIKTKKYELPSSTNEITFEQFLRIKDWDGILYSEFVEKILDIDFDEALEITDSELKAKDFAYLEQLFIFDKKIKTITVAKKKIKLPKDLFNNSSLGQLAELSLLINKEFKEGIDEQETYKIICKNALQIDAIYLYPYFFDCKFNSKKYRNVEQYLLKSNYKEVLGVAFFLLMSYLKSKKMSETNLGLRTSKNETNSNKQEQTN